MSGSNATFTAHGTAAPAAQNPAWQITPKRPFTATVSATMSEDYLATSDVLIGGATSPLAVFHDYDGTAETLAICADNFLYHVASNQANESGWILTPVHQANAVDQVAAGTNGLDNKVYAFFTAGGQLRQATLNSNDSWSESGTMPLCTGLAVTNSPLSGELIAYGVTANGQLQVVRQQGDNTWAAATWAFPSPLDADATLLQMIDDQNWALATKSATGVTVYTGAGATVMPSPMQLPTPAPVAQVLVGYTHQNTVLFLFTDTTGKLYSNVHVTDVVTQIPNVKVSKARAGVDRNRLLHFYGTDEQGILSVLHQTGWDTNGPVWAPCIPLDAGLALPAISGNPRDVTAFFAAGQDGALRYLSQDPATSIWTTARAQRPNTAQPYHLTQYRAQISVVDANGNPAANLPLNLSASTAASIVVSGASYQVSTIRHPTLTTDARGTITLATPALSLHAPSLTLNGAGFTEPVTVTLDAGVHAYLSGSAGLNGKPPLTSSTLSSTLQTATTSDGSKLAPAAAGQPDVADAAANGIMHSFGAVAGTVQAAAFADAGIVGFALDLEDLSKPGFSTFTSLDDLEAYRTGLQAGNLGLSWDDFINWAGDVWHGIEQAASTVTHWVVNLAEKTVDLVTQIGDELISLAKVAINGIREVISIVHSICNRIEAFIEKVVDWLRAFFSWSDIWDTKLALEEALTKAVPFLTTFVDQRAKPLVDTFFTGIEQQVRAAFDHIPANATFANPSGRQPLALSAPGDRLSPAPVLLSGPLGSISPGDFTADSQHNWLLDKLSTYFGTGPVLTTSVDLSKPLGDLSSAFSTAGTDFTEALTKFATAAAQAVGDPNGLPQVPLHKLLDPLRDMILAGLQFADHVIDALLDLVEAALTGLQAFLEIPLDKLPVIGPLIGVIEGILGIDPSQVTITGVFCLVAAIPVTLAYKITHGPDAKLFPGGKLPASTISAPSTVGDPVADACKYCAIGATALWALFDSCLDLVPDAGNMVFSIIDIIFPTLIQVFTWPSGVPFTPIPDEAPLDKANLTNWAASWAPILIDLAMLVAPELPFAPGVSSSIARYVDPWGKILLTGTGAFNLAAGLAAIGIDSSDGGAVAANILGPLPNASQVLRIDGIVDASEGVTAALKVFLDFFTGTATAVAMVAS
jgi:hypothetical protein